MPTASPRRWHPKPWRRHAQFAPPDVRRLSAPELRDWRGFIGGARRQRLISPGRLDVAVQVLQFVGWRGAQRLALAVLAAAADVSIDTAHRALADLEQLGLLRRHHLIRCGLDGRTRQGASFIELLPAPASDPQTAGERVPLGVKTLFLAWKRTKDWTVLVDRTVRKALRNESRRPVGGDDEWGRLNAARQIAALAAA